MKNARLFFVALLFTAACSKVSLDRLQGTWQLIEVKDLSGTVLAPFKQLLDTTTVKVVFLENGDMKTFYFKEDSIIAFQIGTYVLLEGDKKLVINNSNIIFNPGSFPLNVMSLRRNKMTLEGKYYLNAINPSVPLDSSITVQWFMER